MKYFYDQFESYSWQYVADTHSPAIRNEVLLDIPPAQEFRIAISRFRPGEAAFPHKHEWEHAMYVMAGTGKITIAGEEAAVKPGVLGYVPVGAVHSVENTGTEDLVIYGVSGPPKTEAGWAQLKKK